MKRIKIKKIGKRYGSNQLKIISIYTVVMVIFGIFVSNFNFIYFADITGTTQGIIEKKTLVSQIDNIKETSLSWPMKYITNRGIINNYEETKWTEWENLADDKKTTFPAKFSDTIGKYKYIPASKIWDSISNPLERQVVLLYKRLLTTTWTASYDSDKLWLPDTGTHAGIDLLSSYKTPIYSIGKGIIIDLRTPCPAEEDKTKCGNGFGNYVIVATNINGEIIASIYAHMNDVQKDLKTGDIVNKGDLVGYLGDSGNTTAPHLHFQINKLGKAEEIKNIDIGTTLFTDWFHDAAGVKAKTYDPISFIENNGNIVDDSFTPVAQGVSTLSGEENKIEAASSTSTSKTENTVKVDSSKETFTIKSAKLSTIDGKLTIGDTVKATIETSGSIGTIIVSTSNNIITPSAYTISPNGKNTYELSIKASQIGNGKLTFSDGTKNRDFYLSVYNKNIEAFGLKIEGPDTLYRTTTQKFDIYPIDKLGNRIETSLKGTIKVVLQNDDNSKQVQAIKQDNKEVNNVISFDLNSADNNFSKIKVYFEGNNKSFVASKNVNTELFIDYKKNDTYGNGISYLIDKGVIKGSKGFLFPKQGLLKADIITMMIKLKYGDKLTDFQTQMKSYTKTKGKFFKDIKGTERYAPYLYMGFKDGLISGKSANANNIISNEEIILLYGNYFGVKEDGIYTVWSDIKSSDTIKKFADAAKKYNLYPFDSTEKFNAKQNVSRISAFEGLYRYLNFKPSVQTSVIKTSTSSSDKVYSNGYQSQLEDVMVKMISF